MRDCWIAPSVLSADFARLGEEVEAVLAAGADLVHFEDVMDNRCVPNLTIGPLVCQALRDYGISGADRCASDGRHLHHGKNLHKLLRSGSDRAHRSVQLIHEHGCESKLWMTTSFSIWLEHVMRAGQLDLMLLMSVNPGFSRAGRFHRSHAAEASAGARHHRSFRQAIRLEVDGGVKTDNIARIAASTDTFVVCDLRLSGATASNWRDASPIWRARTLARCRYHVHPVVRHSSG